MFRITEDPSSGSLVQCLAKNYKNNSIVSINMHKVGVMAAYSAFTYSELHTRTHTHAHTHTHTHTRTHNRSQYAAITPTCPCQQTR
jgi:hypothetical protein